MDEFVIYHIPREENLRANALAQQASGYDVQKRNFQERKLVFHKAEGYVLEEPVRPHPLAGQTGSPSLTALPGRSNRVSDENSTSATISSKTVEDEVGDRRKPQIEYLQDPKGTIDRKIRRWALKFVLEDGELYHRTTDDFLFKCLGDDQARLAMAEVHEGICGTHQPAPKMKWLLKRLAFIGLL